MTTYFIVTASKPGTAIGYFSDLDCAWKYAREQKYLSPNVRDLDYVESLKLDIFDIETGLSFSIVAELIKKIKCSLEGDRNQPVVREWKTNKILKFSSLVEVKEYLESDRTTQSVQIESVTDTNTCMCQCRKVTRREIELIASSYAIKARNPKNTREYLISELKKAVPCKNQRAEILAIARASISMSVLNSQIPLGKISKEKADQKITSAKSEIKNWQNQYGDRTTSADQKVAASEIELVLWDAKTGDILGLNNLLLPVPVIHTFPNWIIVIFEGKEIKLTYEEVRELNGHYIYKKKPNLMSEVAQTDNTASGKPVAGSEATDDELEFTELLISDKSDSVSNAEFIAKYGKPDSDELFPMSDEDWKFEIR